MEEILRFLHVIGATVLLGTGAGIAFFMLLAVRTRDAKLIAHVANTVVIADMVFTASAVIVQPITGYLLARIVGWPLTEGWLALSIGLYVLTGLFAHRIRPPLPYLVRLRLPGVSFSAGNHLADAHPPCSWFLVIARTTNDTIKPDVGKMSGLTHFKFQKATDKAPHQSNQFGWYRFN